MEEKKKRPSSPARIRANAKYNAKNVRQFVLKFNIKTDADIIAVLDSIEGSKQGYIRRLIREDMQRGDG